MSFGGVDVSLRCGVDEVDVDAMTGTAIGGNDDEGV